MLKSQRQAVDRIVHRYRRLGAVLLDPDVGDDELRARLLSTVPEAQLLEDQSDLASWTRADRKARFEQTAERHAGLSRFAGPFLSRMKFVDEQGEGASPTLSALRAYREHRAAGRRGVPPDAPLDFAPVALQPLIRHDGVTDRRRWESALFLKVRDEIQTGNLAIDGAKNFGRFEAFFLPDAEWERVREAFWARAGFPVDPAAAVQQLKARLSDAFDRFLEGVADNRQVAFDDDEWRLKTDAAEQPDPAQSDHLAELHRWLDARSRSIRLADLLIEVENDLGFSVHFQQPGEKRVDPAEVCALLAATLARSTLPSSRCDALSVYQSTNGVGTLIDDGHVDGDGRVRLAAHPPQEIDRSCEVVPGGRPADPGRHDVHVLEPGGRAEETGAVPTEPSCGTCSAAGGSSSVPVAPFCRADSGGAALPDQMRAGAEQDRRQQRQPRGRGRRHRRARHQPGGVGLNVSRRVLGRVRQIGGARAVGLADGAAADRVGGNAHPVHVAVARLHGIGEEDTAGERLCVGTIACLPRLLPDAQRQHRRPAHRDGLVEPGEQVDLVAGVVHAVGRHEEERAEPDGLDGRWNAAGAAVDRIGGGGEAAQVDFDAGQRHLGHADFARGGRVLAPHRVDECGTAAVLEEKAFDLAGVLTDDQLEHGTTARHRNRHGGLDPGYYHIASVPRGPIVRHAERDIRYLPRRRSRGKTADQHRRHQAPDDTLEPSHSALLSPAVDTLPRLPRSGRPAHSFPCCRRNPVS